MYKITLFGKTLITEYFRGGSSFVITYKCKHCNYTIATLAEKVVDTKVLGWDQLTPEEQEAMITYETDGHITVHVICENCESALNQHPEYHALDHFIQ